jgi:putative Holliday junction resolvase
MRLLGVDLGERRTGLALADTRVGLVEPLRVIEVPGGRASGGGRSASGDRLVEALAEAVEEFGPDVVVFGLPVNMDGTEGAAARRVRGVAARLADRMEAAVAFHDERLTSAQADWEMAGSGLTRGQKKKRRDALAAAVILRSFLEEGGASSPGGDDDAAG